MRVVVLGATGNVGTAVVRALRARSEIDEIVGVARRIPGPSHLSTGVTWRACDVTRDPLAFLADADAVVHLAWKIHRSWGRRPGRPSGPRLQPAEPGWLDLATVTPLMDASRARDVLGWQPRRSSIEATAELLTASPTVPATTPDRSILDARRADLRGRRSTAVVRAASIFHRASGCEEDRRGGGGATSGSSARTPPRPCVSRLRSPRPR